MKNYLKTLIAVFLCCIFPVVFCSCKPKEEHHFATEWASDETNHWHECTDENCTEVSDKNAHDFDAGKVVDHKMVYTCQTCGKTKENALEHSYSDTWSSDETNHWKTCTVSGCDEKTEIAEHTYDAGTVQGHDTVCTCTVCGKTKTTTNGHTFSKVWKSDETNHWKECTIDGCTEKTSIEAHNFDKGVNQGHNTVYECMTCHYTKTEQREHEPVANHYEYDETNHWEICSIDNCNEILNVTPHDYDNDHPTYVGHKVIYTCATCGATREADAPHNFEETYSSDNYGHWHACTIAGCTEKGDYEEHTLVDGVCSVCQREVRDCEDGNHSYNTDWSYDEKNHWHACSSVTCSSITDLSAHTFDEGTAVGHTMVYTCSCGYQKIVTLEHNYSSDWSKNELYHWHACTVNGCENQGNRAPHNYSEGTLNNHKMVYTCTDCGYEKVVDVPHRFDGEWLHDADGHWHTCSVDGCTVTSEKENHSFADADIKNHKEYLVCSICGETLENDLPHSVSEDLKYDETNHWHYCTVPGCTEKMDIAEHTFGDGELIDHKMVYVCSGCGYNKEVVLDHKFDTAWGNDETNHWHNCTIAGCTEKDNLGEHTFDAGKVVNHQMVYTCSDCGYEKFERLEHNFATVWSTDNNFHWHACTVEGCDEKLDEERHSLEIDSETETQITYYCKVCKSTIVLDNDKFIKAIENFANEKYGVKLTNLNLSLDINVNIALAELYISKDENGSLYGFGSGTMTEAEKGNTLISVKILIRNGFVYVQSYTNDESREQISRFSVEDYVKATVSSMLINAPISLEELLEMVESNKETITQMVQTIVSTLSNYYQDNRLTYNANIKKIVGFFFKTEEVDGKVIYTFDYESLKTINNYLNTTTISEAYDQVVGKTGAYTATKAFLMAVPDMKVKEVIKLVQENFDIDIYEELDNIDAIIASAYEFINGIKGGENSGTTTLDENETPIIPSEPTTPTVPTLETIINLILKQKEIDFEVTDIGEWLKTNENKTIVEVINMFLPENKQKTSAELQAMISTTMTEYGNKTIYKFIEDAMTTTPKPGETQTLASEDSQESRLYNMVSGIIVMLENSVSISFETNGNGVILGGKITVDLPNMASGRFELIKDYEPQVDYAEFEKSINDYIDKIEFTESGLPETVLGYEKSRNVNEDGTILVRYYFENQNDEEKKYNKNIYEFTFSEDGKLIKFYSYIEARLNVGSEYCSVAITEQEMSFVSGTLVYNIELNCDNWYYVTISNVNGKSIMKNKHGDSAESVILTFPSLSFKYNTETKQILVEGLIDSDRIEHNYVLKEKVETSYGYLYVYECSKCGATHINALLKVASSKMSEEFESKVLSYNNKLTGEKSYRYEDVFIEIGDIDENLYYVYEDGQWVLKEISNSVTKIPAGESFSKSNLFNNHTYILYLAS